MAGATPISEPAVSETVVPVMEPEPMILDAASKASADDELPTPTVPTLMLPDPVVRLIDVDVRAEVTRLIPLLFVRSSVPVTLADNAETLREVVDVLLTVALAAASESESVVVLTGPISEPAERETEEPVILPVPEISAAAFKVTADEELPTPTVPTLMSPEVVCRLIVEAVRAEPVRFISLLLVR